MVIPTVITFRFIVLKPNVIPAQFLEPLIHINTLFQNDGSAVKLTSLHKAQISTLFWAFRKYNKGSKGPFHVYQVIFVNIYDTFHVCVNL